MSHRENQLNTELANLIRKSLVGSVVFNFPGSMFRKGTPDLCTVWHGRTSWLELKWADPDFDSDGLQDLTMVRLARQLPKMCYYVIYEEKPPATYIVAPRNLANWKTQSVLKTDSISHNFVVSWLRQIHQGGPVSAPMAYVNRVE